MFNSQQQQTSSVDSRETGVDKSWSTFDDSRGAGSSRIGTVSFAPSLDASASTAGFSWYGHSLANASATENTAIPGGEAAPSSGYSNNTKITDSATSRPTASTSGEATNSQQPPAKWNAMQTTNGFYGLDCKPGTSRQNVQQQQQQNLFLPSMTDFGFSGLAAAGHGHSAVDFFYPRHSYNRSGATGKIREPYT